MAVYKYLDPKNDVAFKKIFGSEKVLTSKFILIKKFLNSFIFGKHVFFYFWKKKRIGKRKNSHIKKIVQK